MTPIQLVRIPTNAATQGMERNSTGRAVIFFQITRDIRFDLSDESATLEVDNCRRLNILFLQPPNSDTGEREDTIILFEDLVSIKGTRRRGKKVAFIWTWCCVLRIPVLSIVGKYCRARCLETTIYAATIGDCCTLWTFSIILTV